MSKVRWRFSWSRVVRVATWLFVPGMLAVVISMDWMNARDAWQAWQEQRIAPLPATDEEQVAIVRFLLSSEKFGLPPPPPPPPSGNSYNRASDREKPVPIVFAVNLLAHCSKGVVQLDVMDCASFTEAMNSSSLHDLPLKLRRELLSIDHYRETLPRFEISPDVARFASAKDVSEIFKNGGWWDKFYERYPGTAGYVQVTRAAMTEDRKQALIYVSTSCDGLCGWGNVYYLDRIPTAWKIRKKVLLWIS